MTSFPNADARRSGNAMLLGTLGGIVTMAIHPSGLGSLNPEQFQHMAFHAAVAHALAMVSFVTMFLGACGLTRLLDAAQPGEAMSAADPTRPAFAALVVFALACVAVLIAAAVSGFIMPGIMRHMIRDGAATVPAYRLILDSVFQINQAFSNIYTVASSGAILLWSIAMWRQARALAVYGCVVAPVLIVLIASGTLRLNVHGMTAVVLGQAAWYAGAGWWMLRGRGEDRLPGV